MSLNQENLIKVPIYLSLSLSVRMKSEKEKAEDLILCTNERIKQQ